MPLLGMLASHRVFSQRYPHLETYNRRTDTEFNIHSPLLPSMPAPLALLLSTFSHPYSKPTIQFVHQHLRRRARMLMCCFHLAGSLS